MRNFPGFPVVKTQCFHGRGAWVQSPYRELRSHMPWAVWMRVAFIDLMEAEGTSEAHRAQAREGVNPIDTRATIETGAEKHTERTTSAR